MLNEQKCGNISFYNIYNIFIKYYEHKCINKHKILLTKCVMCHMNKLVTTLI